MKKTIPAFSLTNSRGFTLIELMMTIVVASILLTIAVPAFQAFILNNRMTSFANDMITNLAYARSEAVKRAGNVTVCVSSNQTSCTGGTWSDGWIVVDAGGNVLRAQQALGGTTTLTGANTVIFNATGRMTTPTAATSLTLCSGNTDIKGRQIAIDPTGRARVAVSSPC